MDAALPKDIVLMSPRLISTSSSTMLFVSRLLSRYMFFTPRALLFLNLLILLFIIFSEVTLKKVLFSKVVRLVLAGVTDLYSVRLHCRSTAYSRRSTRDWGCLNGPNYTYRDISVPYRQNVLEYLSQIFGGSGKQYPPKRKIVIFEDAEGLRA